jgi:hypothetical protein
LCSGDFDIFGLPALWPFHDVETYGLTFLQAPESIALNRRVVDENVIATLTAKKSESLCIVEPLYYSLFHDIPRNFDVPQNAMWRVCE